MKHIAKSIWLVGILAIGLPAVPIGSANAATTEWHETLGGKLRLLSAGRAGDAYKAGLQIELEEGWKTYWKVPGDSGIPPILDLEASQNVADLDIRWPAPMRIHVAGSEILGFKDSIIFPFLVKPADSNAPVQLVLNAQVGLCSDLCVPLSADLMLDIPAGGDRDLGSEMLIDRDLALVPTAPREDFKLVSVTQTNDTDGPDKLTILAKIPDGYGKKDLFVEGPESWFLPLTKPVSTASSQDQTFELVLDGLPEGAKSKGQSLTFTLTNGDEAVEQSIKLEK